MRLAVIADIHGNLPALDAVLADIAQRGLRNVVNLGDVASGPLWPREVVERIVGAAMPTLRGNHDRWVAEGGTGGSDAFARERLDPAHAAWLGALPATLAPASGILAFHARPDDDNAYLMEEVVEGRLRHAPAATVAARLPPTAENLLLCAHSHLPGLMALPDGRTVLNPGSVGCPAYTDDTPPEHVSEAGAPHARYAVIEVEAGRLLACDFVALEYDWQRAAAQAEAAGRPGWAHALRTGRMPG